MEDLDSLLPTGRNRRRDALSDLRVLILAGSFGTAREIAGRLADASSQQAQFHCVAVDTRTELQEQARDTTPAAVLIDEAAIAADDVIALMREFGESAFIMLSERRALAEQLEWIHRGIQDLLQAAASGPDIARSVRFSVERKRRLNDLQEALRLEQESVAQMQAVMDQLVGYATRNTL